MKVKIEIPKAAVTQWERNAALDMAIEALKYSEIPNTSDLVSRKAVREMVATWSYDLAEWEDVELALSDVDKLPSAHPEVIHCKDCALWHRTGCPMNIFVKKPEPGYFCGTAKRKESQCGYERHDVQLEENM
jgi:hypothetical protein